MGRTGAVLRETGSSLTLVFSNPRLRRVQLALLASLVGDLAYATAVTVWAYGVGGATAVGIWTAVRMAAAAVTAPLGAAVADRVSRRGLMLATDAIRAVLVGLAAISLVTGLGDPAAVFVLATLAGLLTAPFRSAQRAWMPSLCSHPSELTASNAASGTLESIAFFVGPAIGGLLLVVADVPTVFVLNVITFGVSFALVLAVRTPEREVLGDDVEPDAGAREGFLGELSAGFRLVGRDRDLRLVTGEVCAQTFVGGASKVFLVVIAVEVLRTGASGVGFLDAVLGVGAVLGGLAAIARSSRQRLGVDMTVGVLLWSVPLVLISLVPVPAVAIAALVVVGAANPVVDVNLDTIVQRMTPDALMARVFGALDTCYIATGALGSLVMPYLLHAVGLRWSLVAVATPVAVVALLGLRRMHELDGRLRPPPALDLVRGVGLFAPLTQAVQETIARALVPIPLASGDVVIRMGDVADAFFLIESGRVRVTQGDVVLREQGRGEFFGEIGLLHDVPRTATVTAIEDTLVQRLDRGAFLAAVTGRSRSLAEEVAATRLAHRGDA
ncbi:MFS transporter [Nocardioides sp. KIGAM211]|uniref:MFS transporter n=1 Tax=Nocardioides luti TaxID=2761101 RepID=A0A7X0RJ73_9ACTN|nr:MFS transporter [Nocardioides luti]MBB6629326.1 MFS transporter [Nocardioides luti]